MVTKYKIVPFCPYHFVRTILSNTILSVYHFVHTILSVPFCPLPFCPVTLAEGPYLAARVKFKPTTFRIQGSKPTTELPCLMYTLIKSMHSYIHTCIFKLSVTFIYL